MSGSRFAAGLGGFNTGLFPGLYPTRPALPMPSAPTPSTPAAPPMQAPPMTQPPAPVSVGSSPMTAATGPAMDTAQGGSPTDLGPNPGTISGGGFGSLGWGTMGGALGAIAGMALGAPGLGIAGSALGTAYDVQQANQALEARGMQPTVGWGPAFANNMSLGALGQSVDNQAFSAGLSQPDALFSNDVAGFDGVGLGTVAPGTGFIGGSSMMGEVPNLGSFPFGGDYGGGGGEGGTTDGSANQGASGLGSDVTAGATEGWRKGGYTGDDGDGRIEVAGKVHEREVVLRPEAVDYYGIGPLLALNRMEVPKSRLASLMGKRD